MRRMSPAALIFNITKVSFEAVPHIGVAMSCERNRQSPLVYREGV